MIPREKFLRILCELIECDNDWRALAQLQRGMEEEFYRDFYNTYRKTVELCKAMETVRVPESVHWRLIQTITITHKTVAKPARPKKKKR